jgi:hypothetical protein
LALVALATILACGGSTKATKEDRSEGKAIEAERLLRESKAAMEKLDAESAETKLGEVREILDSEDGRRHPDRAFLADDLKAAEVQLVDVKKELARREHERQVAERRSFVAEALGKLEKAVMDLGDPDEVSPERLEAVTGAQEALADELAKGASLESSAPEYDAYVKTVRKKIEVVAPATQRATLVLAFRNGPYLSQVEANELEEKAKAEAEVADKVPLLIEAKTKLESCVARGKDFFAKDPKLSKLRFTDAPGGAKTSAQIVSSCERRAKALGKQLDKLKKPPKTTKKNVSRKSARKK